MAIEFLLLYLLFSRVNADCTSTYLDHYDGNIVGSYDDCVATCDGQGGICGSAYYESSSGACVTIDCIDDTFNLAGWTQYTVAGAEKCPEPLPWTPSAQPASTKLTTVTIVDPFGTKCTDRPASTSAVPTGGVSTPSSASPTTSTGPSTSGPGVTTSPSSAPTSVSSPATPSPTPNEASSGSSGIGGLVIAGIYFMFSFLM